VIRAALKSLLGRKVRLLMSTFAIVLGVAFVVGTLVFSDTLNRSFTALFASTVGDVVVAPEDSQTALGFSTETLPADLVDRLATLPGAARADGNVSATGVYVLDEDDDVVGGSGPPSLGANYTDAPAAGGAGLQLVEGRAPSGLDEVVVDERTAERADRSVGDQVSIVLPEGEQTRVRPTIVGILGFPDGGSLNGATYVAWDTATAQDLFYDGADVFTDIWVTARDGVTQDELAEQARPLLPDEVEAMTGDDAADEQASELLEAIGFLTTFLLVFAAIALVVGSFLVVNTFSMLVAQRSRELALLRALGASKRQVVRSVQVEALVLGAVGATIGIGLGVLLAIGLRALFATFGLDLSGQSLVYSPRTFLAAYAVGILVTMAAAYLPARRTSRIAPVQAMRDDVALPESSLRRRFVVGLALALVGGLALAVGLGALGGDGGLRWIGAGVLGILLGVTAMSPVIAGPFLRLAQAAYARSFGPVGNLAGQNSLRNPRRTAATASALMIGLTLACAMAIIGSSAKASVDRTVEENFVGDYVVSGIGFGSSFNPAVGDQIASVPGVRDVVRQRFQLVPSELGDEAVGAVDPGQVDVFGLRLTDGSAAELADRTLLVSESWADDNERGVGDTLDVDPPSGEQTWRIVGVYEDNPLVGPVLTTLDTLSASGYEDRDFGLLVLADDGAGDELQDALEDEVGSPTVAVADQAEFAAEQREPIDQFVLIIYALLGLALLIAVLGIVNTLALSVVERTREVGLLRAIGVTRGQLRWMITLESVVIAVLGALLGVVLGVGFGVALMRALRDEGLEVISVPVDQLAVFLLLGVVIGVVAAILPARRAARLDVLDAIATD
jgi:putative ABC transport system permease protein